MTWYLVPIMDFNIWYLVHFLSKYTIYGGLLISDIEWITHRKIRNSRKLIISSPHDKDDLEAKGQKCVHGYQIETGTQWHIILAIWNPYEGGNKGQPKTSPHIWYYQIWTSKSQTRFYNNIPWIYSPNQSIPLITKLVQ